MQDEISRMSKKELERALRDAWEVNQDITSSSKKSTVTKMRSVDNLTADEWLLMYRQAAQALEKMGIDVPSDLKYATIQFKIAERNVQLSTGLLALILTRILDMYHSSQTHAHTQRLKQLKDEIKYIGSAKPFDRVDKQIDLAITGATSSLEVATQIYQALGYTLGLEHFAGNLEEARAALPIALAFRDASRNLLDGHDQGESLTATINTYEGDIQRMRGATLQAEAPKYGGPKSDKQMDYDILETVSRSSTLRNAMKELVNRYPELGDPSDDFENFKKRVQNLKKKL